MTSEIWLQLILGVAGTWVGAEMLVRGSARIALLLGIRPLVVGLTVVALGTSSPEAIVSVLAALRGSPDIALGNVVGSNIANLGLILGLSALLRPISVDPATLREDVPLMLAATGLGCLLMVGGAVSRLDGVLLLSGLAAYILYYLRTGHAPQGAESTGAETRSGASSPWPSVALAVAGLVVLLVGAQQMLNGAQGFGRAMGIPEAVIGVTMVAVGTSLPELVASVVALLRGHQEIAVGNVLGSNVFNLLFVLGLTSTIQPVPVASEVLGSFVPAMVAFSLLLLPLLKRRHRLTRVEGALLLAGYVAFTFLVY